MTDRLWLTPAEAAIRLGRPESSVRRLVAKGLLASHRSGLFLKFTEADLDAYVASCAMPAGGKSAKGKASTNPLQTTKHKNRAA